MKKFTAYVLAICAVCQSVASAQITATQTSEEGDIKIDIALPDKYIDDYYSLYVLNPGKTKEDLQERDSSAVQYYHQGEYPVSGESIDFRINRSLFDSGIEPFFRVLLRAGDYSEEIVFSSYGSDVRAELIEEINSKSAENIDTLADRTVNVFNAGIDSYDKITDKTEVARKLFEICDKATVSNVADYMRQAIIISGAESGDFEIAVADRINYNDIIGADGEIERLLADIKKVNNVNNALKENEYSSVEKLREVIEEEIILEAVYGNKSLGYGHIEKIIKKYSEYLEDKGLDIDAYNSSKKDSVGQKLLSAGKKDFDGFISKINSLTEEKKSSSSKGGGSSSSSKGGGITAVGKVPEGEQTKDEFADLSGAEWARAKVMSLKDRGIVSGDGENFYPNNNVTRAEFTKMIVDALGISEQAELAFDDVESGAWYESYIKRGVGASVIYGDGTSFYPNDNIKRQDIAAICYRALKYKGFNLVDTGYAMSFNDTGTISDYAKESVQILYQYGIINGNELNEFLPVNNATRAEAAVIIWGILSGIEKGFVPQRSINMSNPADVSSNNLEQGTFLMVRAGIISSENAGNPGKKVTRGEFAKILAKYANKEDIKGGGQFYGDVTAETPYNEYINSMTSLGYLPWMDSELYEPEKLVTENEAKIAILNVLGYGKLLNDENEYLKTAAEVGIESEIPCGGDEAVTMGGIISMFESSLEADVMEIDMSGGEVRLVNGAEFLESFYGIKQVKGVMNGNNITSYDSESSPHENFILIDSEEYEIDNDLYFMNDYLGYQLQVAYTEKDNKVVGFKKLKNSELVVSDNEIEEYKDGRIYYITNSGGKKKNVSIPDDAVIVYNGVVEKSYTEEMFDISSGSIEFVGNSSDNYNVVKIYDYDTIITNGASETNRKIFSSNTGTVYSLDDYDNVIIRTGSGALKDVGDIKGGNVLSIAESLDKRNIIVNVSDGTVNGKINRIQEDSMLCIIDGKEYELIDGHNLDSSMLGSNGKFYIDYKGRVVWASVTGSDDMRYGFLVKASYNDSEEQFFFKIFTDSGDMVTVNQPPSVRIDGDKVEGNAISYYFLNTPEGEQTDKMQPQLIKYRMNSEGIIKEIDTAYMGANENASSLTLNNEAYTGQRLFSQNTGRLVETGLAQSAGLYNAMRLDNSTVIFRVPEADDMADADDTDFSLVPFGTLYEGRVLAGPVLAYDTDFENADLVKALTYTNARTTSGVSHNQAFLVTAVTESINAEEEVVPSIKGYDYFTKTETLLTSSPKENVFENVKPGDVIRYALDSKGNVEELIIDLDKKTAALGKTIVPWVQGNMGMGSGSVSSAYMYGIITHKNGNYINVSGKVEKENGEIKRGGITYDITNAEVLLFDTKTNRIEKISSDELSEYLYDVTPSARVYFYSSFTLLVNAIVYI